MTETMGPCKYCGNVHRGRCPEVKAVEYHEDGGIKRIEFVTPSDRCHGDFKMRELTEAEKDRIVREYMRRPARA